ncbi:phage tail domain-containing protein [Dellaglioa sp. L3N]
MTSKYWVKAIIGGKEFNLTDLLSLDLIEVDLSSPSYSSNNISRKGIDGELPINGSYAPLKLDIKFKLKAHDNYDYHMILREANDILCGNKPYYIIHEKSPGMMYAVDSCDISRSRTSANRADVTLSFNIYKGFSESLGTMLDMFNYDAEKWQIGQNLPNGEDLQYVFQRNSFSVYNASSFEVNPLMGHQLDIALTCEGMPTIRNVTNGSSISFKKQVTKSNVLLLNGVYPYLDDKRCGRNTDHGIIKLAKGWNNIKITNANNVNIAFNFHYLYR